MSTVTKVLVLSFLAVFALPALSQTWYTQQLEKSFYDIQVDLSGVDFSKSKRDEFRIGPWLTNLGKSELQMKFRNAFRRKVPFEFNPARADIIYRFEVTCRLVGTKVGLKLNDFDVNMIIDYPNPTLKGSRAGNEIAKLRNRKVMKRWSGSADEFKFLIEDACHNLFNMVDHYQLLGPKYQISVMGDVFSHSFTPGSMGRGDLVLVKGSMTFDLNGRRVFELANQDILLEAVQTPIFGPNPMVKMSGNSLEPVYFRFADKITFKEARKRCRLINRFIGNK